MRDRITATLNVGLDNNPLFARKTAQQIADYCAAFFEERGVLLRNTLVGVQLVRDDENSNVTEPTAVVEFDSDSDAAAIRHMVYELALATTQEAIAVYIDHPNGKEPSEGFLTGPRADAWGGFDVNKFEIGDANAGSWTFSNLQSLTTEAVQ